MRYLTCCPAQTASQIHSYVAHHLFHVDPVLVSEEMKNACSTSALTTNTYVFALKSKPAVRLQMFSGNST
jgi:hypothetical protein